MIPFIDLQRQHAALRAELLAASARVIDSSQFVLGAEGRALEQELAALSGVAWALGVASGTDALRLTLTALGVGPGHEVITPAFSFVASATTIMMAGATPVVRVLELARAHRLAVIEDAAQAIGGAWAGEPVGAWGDAACLSFYPTKNLGACGDGGMVVTRRQDVPERIAKLRHHGDSGRYEHVELGYCSRLDELQAAFLRVKLRRLPEWTTARRRIAGLYHEGLSGVGLELPTEAARARHVYHLFTVRHPRRDALAKLLTDDGISPAVYYPRSVPDQPMFGGGAERRWPEAWRASREVLSLPCFAELTDDEVERAVAGVRRACERL